MEFTDYHLDPCQIAHGHAFRHLKDNHVRGNAVPVHYLAELIKELFIIEKYPGLVHGYGPHLVSQFRPMGNPAAGLLQHIHIQFSDESVLFEYGDELIRIMYDFPVRTPADKGLRTVKGPILQKIFGLEIHMEFPIGQRSLHLTGNLNLPARLLMHFLIIKCNGVGSIAIDAVKGQQGAVNHGIRR